ncbi:hypothetical protein ACLOJK_018895 [Asimina triloba]
MSPPPSYRGGQVPSQCLRPATVAPPAAVPTAGRYRNPLKHLVFLQYKVLSP